MFNHDPPIDLEREQVVLVRVLAVRVLEILLHAVREVKEDQVAWLRGFPVNETISGLESRLGAGINREPVNVLHVLEARRAVEVELIGLASGRRRLDAMLPARQLLDTMLQMPAETCRQEYVVLDYRFHTELGRQAGNNVLVAM